MPVDAIDLRIRCMEAAARTAAALPDGAVNHESEVIAIAETFLAWVQEAPVDMPRAPEKSSKTGSPE